MALVSRGSCYPRPTSNSFEPEWDQTDKDAVPGDDEVLEDASYSQHGIEEDCGSDDGSEGEKNSLQQYCALSSQLQNSLLSRM